MRTPTPTQPATWWWWWWWWWDKELTRLKEESQATKPVSAQLRSAEDKLKHAETALNEQADAVLRAQEALRQAHAGLVAARQARDDAQRACNEISASAAASGGQAPTHTVSELIAKDYGIDPADQSL